MCAESGVDALRTQSSNERTAYDSNVFLPNGVTSALLSEDCNKMRDREAVEADTSGNKKTNISPIVEHIVDSNHTIDWTNARVIKSCDKEFVLKFNEAIEIRKVNENDLMNEIMEKTFLMFGIDL